MKNAQYTNEIWNSNGMYVKHKRWNILFLIIIIVIAIATFLQYNHCSPYKGTFIEILFSY